MKSPWILALLAVTSSLSCAYAQEVAGDVAVQSQWFTGSLEAPSPALPKTGILAVEPYFIFQSNTGTYDTKGIHHSVANDINQVESVTAVKYALTDRLTVQALPSASVVWNTQTTYSGVGDLPIEFEYRFNDENNKTGWPSITAALGVTIPTGNYEHLHNTLSGFGSGAYTLKEGLLFQSLFDTWGHHPMRLRFYGAAYESAANVSVQDISVYGTNAGFHGQVAPGFSSTVGLGAGYGLDQRWVLALDLVQNYAAGFHLSGTDAADHVLNTNAVRSARFALAPAVEYNWSDSVGIIVGVEFSAAGRNTSSYVAPQIALSMSF
jgi:hypothetical protein